MTADISTVKKVNEEVMYTDVIEPSVYNKILSEQHIYIAQADRYCMDVINKLARNDKLEIVELGCGPARALAQLAQLNLKSNITGVDVDEKFLEFAKNVLDDKKQKITLIKDNIVIYQHEKPIDICFSIGVHHHIAKGKKVNSYLENIYKQLKKDGVYIVVDEFIPHYSTEAEREIRLAIWYSHVISHALKYGYMYLADEEARIFLDDILEGKTEKLYKNKTQVEYILSKAPAINKLILDDDLDNSFILAKEMLSFIFDNFDTSPSSNTTLDLSREDYKICFDVFKSEYEKVGFKLKEKQIFGNLDSIGAMAVYVLSKN